VPLPHPAQGFLRPKRREEVRLEIAFSRYETYEEKMREVYRPKGLLAFAAAAGGCVRLL